ncbi:tRNA (adenosine(37)-N6)-threonylcarbamoyltransferase complex ATPase subunit type 1 TsaE [Defluviimonas sp. WL0002]|uniref:tRNA threonylcarbamoyladenosine biosynthesis protein TsaE n=1 Tax=Albidovulum marisflavi TaxID=2984159 RepID=A0ABT2Z7Z5_9RHOB|nr:tRNA (adenosine(37)-N6)-threonylcarbamoyltransferase complex ATPase subunit type 1 TsaE [Defluviimonas sp. WL0002]MCV2867259.1 tRNA (adenosine(37)-N6)-threonylcarbamoyltransferase complex ATPase subunit type 1 TsaE [Defluviimonas sp. WL0002]
MDPNTDHPTRIELRLPDAQATEALARRLAPLLRGGDTILLEGDIGAGKTHFARALIRTRLQAIGLDEDVPSPTFTIVQTYDAGDVEIWHADLYRLSGADEIWELGLDDAFRTAICLVEWPDRLGPFRPESALSLRFEALPDDTRRLVIRADGGRALQILAIVSTEAQHGRA